MEEYVEALSNLVSRESSLFKVYEPDVLENSNGYSILINTDAFFAGDIIHFFTIDADDITDINLQIDGNIIYSSIFEHKTSVTFEYHRPINVVACDKSEIKLNIKARSIPLVYTYYTLLQDRKRYYRKNISGNPGYVNGYFGKIYTGVEFSR